VSHSRAVGLACAIVLESVRVWADDTRNRASLGMIQRDAENFSHYIEEGSWKIVIGERRHESDTPQGQDGRAVQHRRYATSE
jgi:hypothetical protein